MSAIADNPDAPIFVVGASRSGTTMLRLILNSHSRIAIPQELKYFRPIPWLTVSDWREPDWSSAELNEFTQHLVERVSTYFEELDVDHLRSNVLGKGDLRAPMEWILRGWATAQGKPRWGEKTPKCLFFADVLIDMFPDAQFVYICRDPRGAVASMNNIEYFENNSIKNVTEWSIAIKNGKRLLANSVPSSQIFSLRYEDIVESPKKVVSDLCDFLGEEFEPEMLSFHKTAHKELKQVRTPNVTKKIQKDNAEKWRESLSTVEVEQIESLVKSEMMELGYEPISDRPPLIRRITTKVKARIFLQDLARRDEYRRVIK